MIIYIITSLYCDTLQNELVPFQLFYENGKPWVTVYFYGALKESKIHRMIFFVSILLIASVDKVLDETHPQ